MISADTFVTVGAGLMSGGLGIAIAFGAFRQRIVDMENYMKSCHEKVNELEKDKIALADRLARIETKLDELLAYRRTYQPNSP